ncbi:MAG: hypothetical protein QOC82_3481 [Frankiaceae bacterium]|jgi:hypothetical protein|nr:hypothetical protein [Frankiaceae bacterium]
MGLVVATTVGLVIWIVLWATGEKAMVAFLITTVVIIIGATARILAPYLPGRE